jgi:hypothetical protein
MPQQVNVTLTLSAVTDRELASRKEWRNQISSNASAERREKRYYKKFVENILIVSSSRGVIRLDSHFHEARFTGNSQPCG